MAKKYPSMMGDFLKSDLLSLQTRRRRCCALVANAGAYAVRIRSGRRRDPGRRARAGYCFVAEILGGVLL